MQQNFEPEQENRTVRRTQAEPRSESAHQEQSAQRAAAEHVQPVETVLAALRRQVRRSTWCAWLMGLCGFALIATGFAGILGMQAVNQFHAHAVAYVLDLSLISVGVTTTMNGARAEMAVSGLTPLLIALLCGSLLPRLTRERKRLTSVLAGDNDVRAVGPLIGALYLRDNAVHAGAAAGLRRLLPRLRKDDAALVDSQQRSFLSLYLTANRWSMLRQDSALALEIVLAYSEIGDGSELSVINRLAKGIGDYGKDNRIREAAQRYLDETKVRAEQTHLAETLVRASQAGSTLPGMLLRPADGMTAADPQLLLRAEPVDEGAGTRARPKAVQ